MRQSELLLQIVRKNQSWQRKYKKFSGNIDLAQDFYLGLIPDKRKIETKELIKRVALADGALEDKETRFLVRMKQDWGYEFFD